MAIGILALQGDYEAHDKILKKLGSQTVYVTTTNQLAKCKGLIIPGGETTTMLKLIKANNLLDSLLEFVKSGKPIFGTCAGAILLAKKVLNPAQTCLGLIDITIERNSYGRQLASSIKFGKTVLSDSQQEMVFIRAPRIVKVEENVKTLAECEGEPVCVQQGCCIAATFHPELSNNLLWHKYFLDQTK